MFSKWFNSRCKFVPFSVAVFGTKNINVLEYSIYVFGFRVATFDKYVE